MAVIKIDNLYKTFRLKSGNVEALDGVSLEVNKGETYGVIGYSGAGKSTLARCINFLEYPDSGVIGIDFFGRVEVKDGKLYGKDGRLLKDKELNRLRRGVGMIFQHFNLLDRSTVFDNIAFPLKNEGMSKEAIEKRVLELLETVDLREKADVYPSQLSGGQKQRVAIARALANNPQILLSDEATSALDPEATESILNLLKKLKSKFGLTIIVITHEMSVIKSICDRVAVMEDGRIVEEGRVLDIFSSPQQPITKKFVSSTSSLSKVDILLREKSPLVAVKEGERLMRLSFGENVTRPVITDLIRKFGLEVNIVLANVEVIGDEAIGGMILILKGGDEAIEKAVAYLKENDVKAEEIHE